VISPAVMAVSARNGRRRRVEGTEAGRATPGWWHADPGGRDLLRETVSQPSKIVHIRESARNFAE
jgi:hypothetical protein